MFVGKDPKISVNYSTQQLAKLKSWSSEAKYVPSENATIVKLSGPTVDWRVSEDDLETAAKTACGNFRKRLERAGFKTSDESKNSNIPFSEMTHMIHTHQLLFRQHLLLLPFMFQNLVKLELEHDSRVSLYEILIVCPFLNHLSLRVSEFSFGEGELLSKSLIHHNLESFSFPDPSWLCPQSKTIEILLPSLHTVRLGRETSRAYSKTYYKDVNSILHSFSTICRMTLHLPRRGYYGVEDPEIPPDFLLEAISLLKARSVSLSLHSHESLCLETFLLLLPELIEELHLHDGETPASLALLQSHLPQCCPNLKKLTISLKDRAFAVDAIPDNFNPATQIFNPRNHDFEPFISFLSRFPFLESLTAYNFDLWKNTLFRQYLVNATHLRILTLGSYSSLSHDSSDDSFAESSDDSSAVVSYVEELGKPTSKFSAAFREISFPPANTSIISFSGTLPGSEIYVNRNIACHSLLHLCATLFANFLKLWPYIENDECFYEDDQWKPVPV